MNLIDSLMEEFTEVMSQKNIGELNTAHVILQAQFNNCVIVKAGLIKAHESETDEVKKKELATLVLKFLGKMQLIEQKTFWLGDRIKLMNLPPVTELPPS